MKNIINIIFSIIESIKFFLQKSININLFKINTNYTLLYPYFKPLIPKNGKYDIKINMNNCILCQLCLKICPTKCISITRIKAKTKLDNTSNGFRRVFYASNFEIDMNKCMYCGLCDEICPTKCISMNNSYSVNTDKIKQMKYQFKNDNT
ncbi:MAG: 4Fe-4S binding protein [Bacteroides sp.]|nr:MAG: 4Fe-4S binding protein [Bacteroides sp.]